MWIYHRHTAGEELRPRMTWWMSSNGRLVGHRPIPTSVSIFLTVSIFCCFCCALIPARWPNPWNNLKGKLKAPHEENFSLLHILLRLWDVMTAPPQTMWRGSNRMTGLWSLRYVTRVHEKAGSIWCHVSSAAVLNVRRGVCFRMSSGFHRCSERSSSHKLGLVCSICCMLNITYQNRSSRPMWSFWNKSKWTKTRTWRISLNKYIEFSLSLTRSGSGFRKSRQTKYTEVFKQD